MTREFCIPSMNGVLVYGLIDTNFFVSCWGLDMSWLCVFHVEVEDIGSARIYHFGVFD